MHRNGLATICPETWKCQKLVVTSSIQNRKVAGKPSGKSAARAVARAGAAGKDVDAFFQQSLQHRQPLLAAISFP